MAASPTVGASAFAPSVSLSVPASRNAGGRGSKVRVCAEEAVGAVPIEGLVAAAEAVPVPAGTAMQAADSRPTIGPTDVFIGHFLIARMVGRIESNPARMLRY